ncbi:hypothetical protein I7I53_12162 [Histoplasma capsulatum var. duboisii H88]|uniref:Uncharacterized protein n=1 Tax=Ajellomyces capsulatus (strain H88) TaxID=544711 RepID=A0A8A1LZM4_AJEC8|nr:hypothetical protein I7I53_12162 [Histoplasma capsulatum var. duboisii H88]
MDGHTSGQKWMISYYCCYYFKTESFQELLYGSCVYFCVYRDLSSIARLHALREAFGMQAMPALPPGR